jgi:hypothetical protein
VTKYRNKPIVMDWDGDGLVDIIGYDSEEKNLLFFKRYRDERTGELRLAKGVPLKYIYGADISPANWHSYSKYYNASDWRGIGVYDIHMSTSEFVLYLENKGTNEKPVFMPPMRLSIDGIPIKIGHHVSTPLPVDWDKSGRMDLMISGESGLFYLFRRNYLESAHKKIKAYMEGDKSDQIFNKFI